MRAPRYLLFVAAAASACLLFPSLDGLDDGGVDSNIADVRAEGDAMIAADVSADSSDSSKDVTSEPAPALDAGAPPDAPALLCGAHWCLTGKEVCCVNLSATNPQCASADAGCPTNEISMACDDPTDCALLGFPNTYCCVTELPNDVASSVSCLASCAVEAGISTRLCDANDASICAGRTCAVSTATLPGIFICK